MNKIFKILGVLLFAGFSFYYTEKVTNIINNNDPIMWKINEEKNDRVVSKIEPIVLNDEYITGVNGCIVDEKESYYKMKNNGEYKEDLFVMKEDEVKNYNKYIIGGNKEYRKVSLIFTELLSKNVNIFIKSKKIKINYFLDGNYIEKNTDILKEVRKISNIYNYGRNNIYESKYITYDNYIINSNFNSPDYCLVTKKDDNVLDLCNKHNMKTIKVNDIDNSYNYVKENLGNGKIFLFDKVDNERIKVIINYIMSKGYEIVGLDELLNNIKKCN